MALLSDQKLLQDEKLTTTTKNPPSRKGVKGKRRHFPDSKRPCNTTVLLVEIFRLTSTKANCNPTCALIILFTLLITLSKPLKIKQYHPVCVRICIIELDKLLTR